MSEFYKYLKEIMDGFGLAAPESLFGTAQTANGTAVTLVGAVEKNSERK